MPLSAPALLLLLATGTAVAAPGEVPEVAPDAATRAAILDLRERAWRAWFANDRAAFLAVVPDELVALGWDGGAWQDRDATLDAMAAFAAGGRRIRTLAFPHDVFQRYGDTVILYTRFRIELEAPDGSVSETRGRGTEVFVRRHGRWIHTGWHLDPVAD